MYQLELELPTVACKLGSMDGLQIDGVSIARSPTRDCLSMGSDGKRKKIVAAIARRWFFGAVDCC